MTLGLILIIIGIVLIIVEASEPGFFIAIPGGVMITLGVIAVAFPEILISIWTPLILAAVVIPLMFLSMKMYQRISPPTIPTTTMSTSLVGEIGKVLAPVEPDDIIGKIKIKNQIWSATAESHIPAGKKAQVIEARGVHVVVREIEDNIKEDKK